MLLDRIGQHQVRRVGRIGRLVGNVAQMAPRGIQRVERIEGDENPVAEIAFEHARFMRRPKPSSNDMFSTIANSRIGRRSRVRLPATRLYTSISVFDATPRRPPRRGRPDRRRASGCCKTAPKFPGRWSCRSDYYCAPASAHRTNHREPRLTARRGSRGRSERSRRPRRRTSTSEFRARSRAG